LARAAFTETTFDLWRVWPKRVENQAAPENYAVLAFRSETLGQSIALGNSREPPAFSSTTVFQQESQRAVRNTGFAESAVWAVFAASSAISVLFSLSQIALR
jgi:hypothetical protein